MIHYHEQGVVSMTINYVYGYARVSTQQQELIRQLDMLKQYNCTEILTEKISGTKADRPELNRLKDKIRPGDTLIIESFSRLGRSTKDLIDQRTREGLNSARARGRKGGRPKVKEKNIEKALKLYDSKEYSVSEIVVMSGISQATLYRYIQKKK